MFGANLQRGREMMQNMLCHNGNCSQVNCLLRHLRPPPNRREFDVDENGYPRGITDRAEAREEETETEEDLRRAIEESLVMSLTCQYCKRFFETKDDLQFHFGGNCTGMEVGEEIEIASLPRSWEQQEEEEELERSRVEEEEEKRRKSILVPAQAMLMLSGEEKRYREKAKKMEEETTEKMKKTMEKRRIESIKGNKKSPEQKIEEVKENDITITGGKAETRENCSDLRRPRRDVKPTWQKKIGIENEKDKLDAKKDGEEKTKKKKVGGEETRKEDEKTEGGTRTENKDANKSQQRGKEKVDKKSDKVEIQSRAENKKESKKAHQKISKEEENLTSTEKAGYQARNNKVKGNMSVEQNKDKEGEDQQKMMECETDDEENELEIAIEKLEKKDTIINDQTNQIEELKREMRDLRIAERKKEEELKKVKDILINKEDYIGKLSKKISELGTRELVAMNKKVTKKEHKGTQTDKEPQKRLIESPGLGILDKLPAFDRKCDKIGGGTRKLLNINMTRGKQDRCFNCIDLEKKIKDEKNNRKQLEELVKAYQEKLQNVNALAKESAENEGRTVCYSRNEGHVTNGCPMKLMEEDMETDGDPKANSSEDEGEKAQPERNKEDKRKGEIKRKEEIVDRREHKTPAEKVEQKRTFEAKKKVEDEEIEKDVEIQVKDIRKSTRTKKKEKDHSKLCYRWVWSEKCDYPNCKFTHKKLCRTLRKKGECDLEECQDGHSTDGICWSYNSRGGCRFTSEYCKFLHISVKSIKQNDRKKNNKSSRTDEEEKQEDEEDEDLESQENMEREEYINKTTYYDEDYRLEIETRPENEITDREGDQVSESREKERKKEERKENRRVSFKEERTEEHGRPDPDSFLGIDSRHDVWKQIRGLKEEIRNLERDMREGKRRYGGRNL